ncbi:hypothetical protein EOD41_02475 [Mucilaginibacter limnophilus]|uniref:Uncharacterized protein n=1 Tax=Mucilaginibacter limnophilus TaxID=1932778 RepID=A0A437MYS0_9SPHI|nr:hypothetical protein [Mucilaginibacter limnophilus]RVU02822.1 hypothetical protein EOD41_02475 [Mucilaginibacter limnophilus]
MSIKKEILSIALTFLAYSAAERMAKRITKTAVQKREKEIQKEKVEELLSFIKKIHDANKLINEESNRLITWSLSIAGGSILAMISTSYVRPEGIYLYLYLLFPIGWILLSVSLYFGELATRIYIAGATVNNSSIEDIKQIGREADIKFARQLTYLRWGVFVFFLWLVSYLTWFVFLKK